MRHLRNLFLLSVAVSFVAFRGCAQRPEIVYVGKYRVEDRRVMFMENAGDFTKEDPKITAYLENVRSKLKKLVTESPSHAFKNSVLPVFSSRWPAELTLYVKDGKLYSVYALSSAPVDWYIANRSLEFTPDGQVNVIDTGASERRN